MKSANLCHANPPSLPTENNLCFTRRLQAVVEDIMSEVQILLSAYSRYPSQRRRSTSSTETNMITCGDLFLLFIAILSPPLTVGIRRGCCSADFIISTCLWTLGILPGIIHAWYIIAHSMQYELRYKDGRDKSRRISCGHCRMCRRGSADYCKEAIKPEAK